MNSPIEICLRFVFWTVFYLSAARIGAWVTASRLRGAAHLAWDGLTGLALLMSGWLLLGIVRFDRSFILAILGLLPVVGGWLAYRDPVARYVAPDRRWQSWAWAITLASLLLLGLLWNRVPVMFYDSLSYQLAQPDLWLLEGRIQPFEWSLHSWLPPGMSVLYGIGLAVGGESWAGDANLMVGAGLLFLIRDLGERLWDRSAGFVAAVALLLVPQLLFALAIPAADLAHGTFVFGSIAALSLGTDRSWRRRAALLAGGALLTKYLGFLMPVAGGALYLFSGVGSETRRPGRRLREALIFVGLALLMLSPWLLSNAMHLGNPVAPALSSWFETTGIADGGATAFARDARGGIPTVEEIRAWPARLFTGETNGIYPGPAWGLPFLGWLLWSLLGLREDARIRSCWIWGVALMAIWIVTYRWERFLLPVSCAACLAFAGSVCSRRRYGNLKRIGAALLIVWGLSTLPTTLRSIVRFNGGAEVFLFAESPHTFLLRSWPQQRLLEAPAAGLNPATDRILMVGEMRHFRVPVRRAAPSGFNLHPLVEALGPGRDPQQVNATLLRAGYTHLLFDFNWIARSAAQYPSLATFGTDPEPLRRYVEQLGAPLVEDGSRALFKIPGAP